MLAIIALFAFVRYVNAMGEGVLCLIFVASTNRCSKMPSPVIFLHYFFICTKWIYIYTGSIIYLACTSNSDCFLYPQDECIDGICWLVCRADQSVCQHWNMTCVDEICSVATTSSTTTTTTATASTTATTTAATTTTVTSSGYLPSMIIIMTYVCTHLRHHSGHSVTSDTLYVTVVKVWREQA